jgi:hypothetical protein
MVIMLKWLKAINEDGKMIDVCFPAGEPIHVNRICEDAFGNKYIVTADTIGWINFPQNIYICSLLEHELRIHMLTLTGPSTLKEVNNILSEIGFKIVKKEE